MDWWKKGKEIIGLSDEILRKLLIIIINYCAWDFKISYGYFNKIIFKKEKIAFYILDFF